jgi:hypothetical protein
MRSTRRRSSAPCTSAVLSPFRRPTRAPALPAASHHPHRAPPPGAPRSSSTDRRARCVRPTPARTAGRPRGFSTTRAGPARSTSRQARPAGRTRSRHAGARAGGRGPADRTAVRTWGHGRPRGRNAERDSEERHGDVVVGWAGRPAQSSTMGARGSVRAAGRRRRRDGAGAADPRVGHRDRAGRDPAPGGHGARDRVGLVGRHEHVGPLHRGRAGGRAAHLQPHRLQAGRGGGRRADERQHRPREVRAGARGDRRHRLQPGAAALRDHGRRRDGERRGHAAARRRRACCSGSTPR